MPSKKQSLAAILPESGRQEFPAASDITPTLPSLRGETDIENLAEVEALLEGLEGEEPTRIMSRWEVAELLAWAETVGCD